MEEPIYRYLSRVEKIKNQLKQVYSKYYGQCDEEMKHSMSVDASFEGVDRIKDVIALRKILKAVNFNIVHNEEPFKTLWMVNRDFVNFKQSRMGPTEYYEKFKSLNKVVDEANGDSYADTSIDIICKETKKDKNGFSTDEKAEKVLKGEGRMLAM